LHPSCRLTPYPTSHTTIYNALCENAGIIPYRTSPCHPQTDYTERINRNIKKCFKFSLLNTNIGTEDVAYDALFDPERSHEALRMLMSRMANLLKTAISNKEKAQIKQKTNYDNHRSNVQFEINDLVLIKTHALSKAAIRYSQSLEDRYKGPYVIIKKISSNAYEIAKLTLHSKGPVNVSEMRLYIPSEKPASWPIANIDDDNEENLAASSQTNPVASSDEKLATSQRLDENKDTFLDQSSKKFGKPQKTVANNGSNKIITPLPKKRGRP
uniref:Integrase catalytic domain-containing protein n=1 Tax=Strigamia maritima TaxID=126957 RepID=T1IUL5_STRMM